MSFKSLGKLTNCILKFLLYFRKLPNFYWKANGQLHLIVLSTQSLVQCFNICRRRQLYYKHLHLHILFHSLTQISQMFMANIKDRNCIPKENQSIYAEISTSHGIHSKCSNFMLTRLSHPPTSTLPSLNPTIQPTSSFHFFPPTLSLGLGTVEWLWCSAASGREKAALAN